MRRVVAVLTAVMLIMPGLSSAQDGGEKVSPPPIDPAKLGVSLARIRHGLVVAESRETVTTDGRKLNIRVEVFGQAPPLDFFSDKTFSLTYGPVPHSAPTHREFLEFVTPQEFRAPVVPIFGLAVWAAQKLADKSKKARCEQEVEEYRQALMQGIAISAPRCTQ